jgi:hypothetical protein
MQNLAIRAAILLTLFFAAVGLGTTASIIKLIVKESLQ